MGQIVAEACLAGRELETRFDLTAFLVEPGADIALAFGGLLQALPVDGEWREIEVFDDGGQCKTGGLQVTLQAVVLAPSTLTVNEESETLLEGEFSIMWVLELLFQRCASRGFSFGSKRGSRNDWGLMILPVWTPRSVKPSKEPATSSSELC